MPRTHAPRLRGAPLLRTSSAVVGPREHLVAGLVVASVAAIPAAFYVAGLGFYLDDHYFLGVMAASDERSVPGLFGALLDSDSKAWLRPAMYFGLAGLFRLFGTNALLYHLLVAALVPACAVLLYAVLARLRAPRFLAIGAPIVFAAAPHYSTDRFWLASYAAPASVALALGAVYALLLASEADGRRLAASVIAGGAALVVSILLYEVAIPLLIVSVVLLAWRGRAGPGSARVVAISSSLFLLAALVYKAIAATVLVGGSSYRVGYETGLVHHLGYLVSGSVKVNFGTYGLGLPYVVGWIFANRPTWSATGASVLVGSLVLVYLTRNGRDLELPGPRSAPRRTWLVLVVAGLVLIVIGYASFLVTQKISFTSAGIDNRVNIAAAIGVAVLTVGLALRAIQLLPPLRQAHAFAGALALLAATGTLITSTTADYWVAASDRQHEVVSRLEASLPTQLAHSTVILDGVCPEIGPGIVFTASYDLAAVLQARYRSPTIEAYVATADVEAESRGLVISTVLFGRRRPHFYPYRPRLLVYDWSRDTTTLLRDRAAARRYLATTPRPSCPALRSFAWGIPVSRYVPFA